MGAKFTILVLASILVLSISIPNAFAITEDTIIPKDAANGELFGFSVSILGDTIIIGEDFDGSDESGAAYVFTRSGSTWIQQQKLTDLVNGVADDLFGFSVSISDDTVIVGAPRHDNGLRRSDSGAAYVFAKSGSTWIQQAKLTAPVISSSDNFGFSVSISGDTAIVGFHLDDPDGKVNSGSAYVFTRSGSTWTQQAKLTASDPTASDQFGESVSISGDTIIVGAPNDGNDGKDDSGSAYVFTRSGSTWTQQAKLTAPDADTDDEFGFSVSISDDTVIIGSPKDDHSGHTRAGSAYVFTKSGSTWTQQQKLIDPAPFGLDQFGFSVSISGDKVIVGAPFDGARETSLDTSGNAFVFTRSGTVWTHQDILTASDAQEDDQLGTSVSISGDTVIVGAPTAKNVEDNEAGAAYVFELESVFADLQVTQSVSQNNVLPDDPFSYTIKVSHRPESTADAKMVVVTSTLLGPGTITDFEPKINCMKISVNTVECKWDVIKNGFEEFVDVFVTVDSFDPDTGEPFFQVFSNSVNVSDSDDKPTDPSNFIKLDKPKVSGQADLLVIQGTPIERIIPGDEFGYIIEITNLDSELTQTDAVDVTLINELHIFTNGGVLPTFLRTISDGTCTNPVSKDATTVTLECTWDRIKIGEIKTVFVSWITDPFNGNGQPFQNTVSVSAVPNEDLGDPDNNKDVLTSPLVAGASDVEVKILSSPELVERDESFSYVFGITALDSSNPFITDATGIKFKNIFSGPGSLDVEGPNCSAFENIVDCEWVRIKKGTTEKVTINVLVNSDANDGATFENSFSVECCGGFDPDLKNNFGILSKPDVIVNVPTFPDADGDGISDDVDPFPFTPSTSFSDGTTTGEIISSVEQEFIILDVPEPVGVNISADPADAGGGIAPTTIRGCDGGLLLKILDAETSVNLTCGSVIIQVISGMIDVEFFGDDGTTATTTLTEGDNVTFEQDTLILTNNGSTPVELKLNGQTIIVNAGTSQTFDAIPRGGGGGGDETPPNFNTVSIFGAKSEQDDGTFGFGGILQKEIKLVNSMPTAIVETGQEIQLRIQIYENSGLDALQHVSLYMNLRGHERQVHQSDTFILYDKGSPVVIKDSNGYLSNADAELLERENNVEAIFSMTFEEEMDLSDIIIRTWDVNRNSRDAIFVDAIQVIPAEQQLEADDILDKQNNEPIMDPEPLMSMEVLDDWAGYSNNPISDSEFLSHIGIDGEKIPGWFKNNNAKWVREGMLTQNEFVNALQFFDKQGFL